VSDAGNRVIVTGAGLAGLTAARILADASLDVLVLEKSRGLGGRLATRRLQSGVSFDHGAQYVRARDAHFEKFIERALGVGSAAPWQPAGLSAGPTAVVGTPGMSALVAPLARDISVKHRCVVSGVAETDGGAVVVTEDGREFACRFAVVAVPAPQASRIIASRKIAARLASVVMAPCWAILARSQGGWSGGNDVWAGPCPEIAWIARDNSKPARKAAGSCWMIHAAPQWSRRNLECEPEEVVDLLMDRFCRIVGIPPHGITYAAAHRWRFAQTETPLGRPFLTNDARSVYCGGDWCLGPRAENAFQSGRAIALEILSAIRK
jgi:renalase